MSSYKSYKEATGLREQIFHIKGAELFGNNSVIRSFILKKYFMDVYSYDLMKKMDKIFGVWRRRLYRDIWNEIFVSAIMLYGRYVSQGKHIWL